MAGTRVTTAIQDIPHVLSEGDVVLFLNHYFILLFLTNGMIQFILLKEFHL